MTGLKTFVSGRAHCGGGGKIMKLRGETSPAGSGGRAMPEGYA